MVIKWYVLSFKNNFSCFQVLRQTVPTGRSIKAVSPKVLSCTSEPVQDTRDCTGSYAASMHTYQTRLAQDHEEL